MRKRRGAAFVAAAAAIATGCAIHRPPDLASVPRNAPHESLEGYIATVRRLAIERSPAAADRQQTIEAQDPDLRDAFKALVLAPGAVAHDRVAEAYVRVGVLDAAYRQYREALDIDRRDAGAYDGLARIWRDWGLSAHGLGDAIRATYYAPRSAAAFNTLGTLLQGIGRSREAVQAFERAVALDTQASYAWSNLCYSTYQLSDLRTAIADCRQALSIDPHLSPAHNNLGLAYAAAGDLSAAASEFSRGGGEAGRHYNLGIVLSASGQYESAVAAFKAAQTVRPDWTLAAERARQAQRMAQASRPAAEESTDHVHH